MSLIAVLAPLLLALLLVSLRREIALDGLGRREPPRSHPEQ